MLRHAWVALVIFAPVLVAAQDSPPRSQAGTPVVPGAKETALTGTLTVLDREGTHLLQLKKDQTYGLRLESRGFFTTLRVEDTDKKTVHSGEGFTMFRPGVDGVYRVRVFSPGGSHGQYVLGVQQLPPPKTSAEGVFEVGPEGLLLNGSLKKPDPVDKLRKKPGQVYQVKLTAGTTYVFDLMSKQFDAFLRLETPEGKLLAQDDDGGADTDARIRYQAKTDGIVRVVATCYNNSATGTFLLRIRIE